ncbi:uncharacterized protein LOC131539171 [Onychostoma macrolepis]|uniref:uncharacterized protein LOC131539171 n=1 Tax=Onychostoma macrolepis TaxID=369639 RepID=UPI00272D661A|nr:uncharacterized protein LOC131539171 [Onychostoma macrolepis]
MNNGHILIYRHTTYSVMFLLLISFACVNSSYIHPNTERLWLYHLAVMSSKKDYLCYVVIHFIEHNEVEVAPSRWLEWNEEVLYCYWPHSNAGFLAKKCAMPDKQLWTKYAVRIFSDTDSYDMARFRARKAQETSHVEDSDGNGGRKVIPPRRFREEEVWLSQQRCAKQAGRFHENSESSQENEITSLHAKRTKQKKRSRITATAPAPATEDDDEDEELQPKRKKSKGSSLMLPSAPSFPSVSTFQSETHHSSSTNQQFQEIYKLFEGLERRLHLKLDQMHADIKTALEAIQQSASQPSTSATASASDLTEVLEEPCKTVNELKTCFLRVKCICSAGNATPNFPHPNNVTYTRDFRILCSKSSGPRMPPPPPVIAAEPQAPSRPPLCSTSHKISPTPRLNLASTAETFNFPSILISFGCANKFLRSESVPPVPKAREMQRFLGFANFYHCFIKGFSLLTAPLTTLLRRKPKSLSSAHEAFESLRTAFSIAPILCHPDPHVPFVVEVDASTTGVGAVLSQQYDEPPHLQPYAYYSKKLTPLIPSYL